MSGNNNRTYDIALWLHNKLGTSNDSWTSGSICSQLNKDVLRSIKDCFPDLQTPVKLKLLLSFFHIPRREEWKNELEEILEIAGSDSELWVSMVAETMKTFPSTGSLNTEISDYEETRPIFTEMINELKRLVNKNSDLGMLPLECQYLNKAALVSVVGQQAAPVKHFTLKRKPKSVALRQELLQKSSDVQSCLKKISAPTVPLRSRGIPRKMTDTTPLKGIPSRLPTGGGFRSPSSTTNQQNQQRPSMIRTPAGRKDGGIKLLDIAEQPLGYAAAKKRKRLQEIEEQQKRVLETQSNQPPQMQQQTTTACTANSSPTTTVAGTNAVTTTTSSTTNTTTPDYAAGLTASMVYSQPATPMPSATSLTTSTTTTTNNIKEISSTSLPSLIVTASTVSTLPTSPIVTSSVVQGVGITPGLVSITPTNPIPTATTSTAINNLIISSSPSTSSPQKISNLILANNNTIVRTIAPPLVASSSPIATSKVSLQAQNTIVTTVPSTKKHEVLSNKILTPSLTISTQPQHQQNIAKLFTQSNLILTTTKTTSSSSISQIQQQQQISKPITSYAVLNTSANNQINIQRILSAAAAAAQSSSGTINLSNLTTTTTAGRPQIQTQIIHTGPGGIGQQQQQNIVQIKTAPTVMLSSQNPSLQNIPPLISTQTQQSQQQPTLVNIQNLQSLQQGRKTLTITAQNPPTSNVITSSIGQFQQQPQLIQSQPNQHGTTILSNTNMSQQPKYAQVLMSSSPQNMNVKGGKTIILANSNILSAQKGGVIIRSVGPGGNTVYQQIPINNVSGLTNLSAGTTLLQAHGPPGLVKTSNDQQIKTQNAIPALVPTSSLQQSIPALTPVMITTSQPQQQQTMPTLITNQQQPTIIRQGIQMLPQGLTLIQRPGQQPQLVQTIQQQHQPQQQLHRTIITAQPQHQQTIQIQQPPQTTIQLIQQPQQQQQQQQQQPAQTPPVQGSRRGLSLSNKHVLEAHDMFKRANSVTRLDKALILGFMAGYRDNPRPNAENVIVIKLNESKENVKQDDDTYALMLVESLIRLDYNTGEWKTFRKYRKLDSSQQISDSQTISPTNQNSVVI